MTPLRMRIVKIYCTVSVPERANEAGAMAQSKERNGGGKSGVAATNKKWASSSLAHFLYLAPHSAAIASASAPGTPERMPNPGGTINWSMWRLLPA
jgi:hypothetical protein